MNTYVKTSGSQNLVKSIGIKQNGAWTNIKNAWVKQAGIWLQIFQSVLTPAWTSRVSGFGASAINAVCYGNGIFVAVGDSGKIAISSNSGATWTQQTSNTSSALNGVSYGNGVFVAVGAGGSMVTSADGITWTARTSGFGATDIKGIAYGNNVFVACGLSGKIGTSSNGVAWTTAVVPGDSGPTPSYYSVSFGNNSGYYGQTQTGFFIGGGDNGVEHSVIGWSTDGTSWSMISPLHGIYSAVTATGCGLNYSFAGGISFYTTGYLVYTTYNASTVLANCTTLRSFCFDGTGQLMAVGDSGTTAIIQQGPQVVAFETTINQANSINLRGCCYGGDTYVAVGENGTIVTRNHAIYA